MTVIVRTVARGERASRPIVNKATALWSIWVVASLIVSDLGLELISDKPGVAEMTNRAAPTGPIIGLTFAEADRTDSTTNKRTKTNINSGVV